MASIERTAYPRFKSIITENELSTFFTPSLEELAYANSKTKDLFYLLVFLALLKSVQKLFYFPNLTDIPQPIIKHISRYTGLNRPIVPFISLPTLYKYQQYIRDYLQIKPFDDEADKMITVTISKMIQIRDDPVDLINIALSELVDHQYELPSYRRIHDLAVHIRYQFNESLFNHVESQLPSPLKHLLEGMLSTTGQNTIPFFSVIKKLPKSPTINHFKEWLEHLRLLELVGDFTCYLTKISDRKLLCFAEEAEVLDAGEMKDYAMSKRHTYLLALHQKKKMEVRDQLVDIFLKRMKVIQNKSKEKLEQTLLSWQEKQEHLIDTLTAMLRLYLEENIEDPAIVQSTKEIIDSQGGADKLLEDCTNVMAYRNNNFYPFFWHFLKNHRQALFDLVQILSIQSATEDNRLLIARDVILANRHRRSQYIPGVIDLNFIPQTWRRMIIKNIRGQTKFHRPSLESCIFHHIASDLRSGDLWVPNSGNYSDYRNQLVSWQECEHLSKDYCNSLKLPDNPDSFARELKHLLTQKAETVDGLAPRDPECQINEDGTIKLKKLKAILPSPETKRLIELIQKELPDRHILDILAYADYYTNFTRHFSPPSGSDSKLANAEAMYRLAIFCFGSELGPAQTAKHTSTRVSPHSLSYLFRRHFNSHKLDLASADLINLYKQFILPQYWGKGDSAAADGTQVDTYGLNLFAEYHFRYRAHGGIAYYHIADNYIALFSNFIQCSIWEAVYILDGLLKNLSDIHPDKLHADTQGQTTIAFALAYFLGIQLLPRIRNWQELSFYRPTTQTRYRNIDGLFGDAINWDLIKIHWKDMMQVVLSIRQGKILPSTILKKLGSYSRQNKLYKAFQEVGRVLRTIFLLDFISNPTLRRKITAETNKVESYNWFVDNLRFGGQGMLNTNDPEEQDKRIKSTSIIANAVMIQNVIDLTNAINTLSRIGIPIKEEDLKFLSPYLTRHIKRFGTYQVYPNSPPPTFTTTLNIR